MAKVKYYIVIPKDGLTAAERFAALTKESNGFYLVGEDLYIGEQKLNNAAEIVAAAADIADNSTDIDEIQGILETLQGDDSVNGSIRKQVADASTALQNSINGLASLIGSIPIDSETGEPEAASVMAYIQKIADDIEAGGDSSNLAARITANEQAIATLNGDASTNGSVAKQVSEAIAAIVANSPSDFDTLKEISDWISTHGTDAAAMNTAITDLQTAVASLQSDLEWEEI